MVQQLGYLPLHPARRLPQKACCNNDARWFIEDFGASTAALRDYDLEHKMFIHYNTALPSSAYNERVFSAVADHFTRKCGKLNDDNFKKELLLKINV